MLNPRQILGKYRIEKRIARGGFADVYRALDTVEGIQVVLKVPHAKLVDQDALKNFRKEVRLTARLDHPHILPIKTAEFLGEHFVIVYPMGIEDLADRVRRRIAARTALDYSEQILSALAYAHDQGIVHCDVKPENIIVFEDDRLRLTDFGIAKVAFNTVKAFGTGTVGYIAPEQAMGRPSPRSDVFSTGLVMYRLFSGQLPEWPFEPPRPGIEQLKRKLHPEMIALIERAIDVDPRRRFADAVAMEAAFERLRPRALRPSGTRTRTARTRAGKVSNGIDWKTVRRRQFLRAYGRQLATKHRCSRCNGPVSEAMRVCPWCTRERKTHRGTTDFPAHCPRCKRGVKLDWRFCPWCYGGLIGPRSERSFSDRRYERSCSSCRGQLMPFMRYCPWCRTKVARPWPIEGSPHRCSRCRSGVLRDFWVACPWCGAGLKGRRG